MTNLKGIRAATGCAWAEVSLLLCFSCQQFGLMGLLEEETLGLDGQEQALESMKKHRNHLASIPSPSPRKKMKLLRKEQMNTPGQVRGTLVACTVARRA